ncbi:glycosyltransferase family 9 protein [Candidatus Riflebacteria bacterium]
MLAVKPENIKRILVIRLKGLGDVVQTMPLLSALNHYYPHIKLAFLTQKAFAPICKNLSFPMKVFNLEHENKGFFAMLKLVKKIRAFKPELVIDLFGNPRTAILSLFSGAKYRFGFDYRGRRFFYNIRRKIKDPDLHIRELFHRVVQELGFSKIPLWKVELSLCKEALQALKRVQENSSPGVIGINPNAAYQAKRWLLPYFKELIALLLKYGFRVALLSGPGEEEYTGKVFQDFADNPRMQWYKNPSILECMGILKSFALFVTNDSGPMHLAMAVGTPVYVFFGPTNPHANGPLNPEDLVFRAEELPCLVCHLEYCSHRNCMAQLHPGVVFDKIQQTFLP